MIGGKSLGLCNFYSECLITVDSGTSMMAMPYAAYDKLVGNYPTTHEPVACKSVKDFGALTFVINGKHYTLEADEWIYPPIFTNSYAELAQTGERGMTS